MCATARSSPPARSRPLPTVRCGGSSSASSRPRRLEPEPEPLARGSYMHAVLEELLGRLEGPVTPESLPAAIRILDEVLAELPRRARRPAARSRADGRAASDRGRSAPLPRRTRRRTAATGSPQGLELRFGFDDEEGSLPALALGDGDDRVLVRGVIDRVDVEPGGSRRAIVRDYKSGALAPRAAGRALARRSPASGRAVHARGARAARTRAGGRASTSRCGGSDLRARGVFLQGDARSGRQWSALTRASRRSSTPARRCRRAARWSWRGALRAGELIPCPQTCSRDGCRYPGICRAMTGLAMEFTAEQAAARSSGAQGDLLLDASAGSGKTSVLVERFVRAVLEDGVDVAAILTITFTDKAAAELRERIRAAPARARRRRSRAGHRRRLHLHHPRLLRARAAGPRAGGGDRPRVRRARPARGRAAGRRRPSTTRSRISRRTPPEASS